MRGQLLYVKQRKPVSGEDFLRRQEREVREVFVIDRVELIFLHQTQEVGKFHRNHALRLEEDLSLIHI